MHCRPSKEILEGKDLAAIAQRALRQQSHLGERVEHNSARIDFLHAIENVLRRLAELHLGGMKQRQLLIGIEARFRRHQLENVDPFKCPAVASRNRAQFALALGQSNVQAALAATARPLAKIAAPVSSSRSPAVLRSDKRDRRPSRLQEYRPARHCRWTLLPPLQVVEWVWLVSLSSPENAKSAESSPLELELMRRLVPMSINSHPTHPERSQDQCRG